MQNVIENNFVCWIAWWLVLKDGNMGSDLIRNFTHLGYNIKVKMFLIQG
jgi:hypothetical protein